MSYKEILAKVRESKDILSRKKAQYNIYKEKIDYLESLKLSFKFNDIKYENENEKLAQDSFVVGDNSIVIEKGTNCYIAAMAYGATSSDFRDAVKKRVSKIEMEKMKDLVNWNGDVGLFNDCNPDLVKIILQSTAKDRSEVA